MSVTQALAYRRQVDSLYHSVMRQAAAMHKALQQLRRSIILCQMLVTTIVVYGFTYLIKRKKKAYDTQLHQ